MKKIIVAAVAALALSTQAQAVQFSVFGHGNMAMPDVNLGAAAPAGFDTKSGMNFGGGVGIHLPFGKGNVGLELDGIYMGRTFSFTATIGESEFSYHAVQIPLLIRVKAGKVLNFGVGGYYSTVVGNVTEHPVTPAGTDTEGAIGDIIGTKKEDYGLVGAVGADFGSGKGAGFFVEGRFVYGLAEGFPNTTGGISFKNMDIQALVGLKF